MKEMIVDSIRVSLVGYQRVVVLKVKGVERYLLIWVGNPEAGSIALALQEIAMPRPLTHDLLRSVIEHLGGRVESVIINDLVDNTFYARIVMGTDGRRLEVDARPSDAIALALRVNVPIYAEDSVLDRAGISPDAEPMTKEEQDKLAVFRNFVNTLDFNDS